MECGRGDVIVDIPKKLKFGDCFLDDWSHLSEILYAFCFSAAFFWALVVTLDGSLASNC